MTSIWKLNNADIYVDRDQETTDPNLVELNPINSNKNSIYHLIFTPDDTMSIEGIVIGSGYLQMIENGAGSAVTLITDLIPGGITVTMKDFKSDRQMVVCQYVDLTQPKTAPVYRVTVTLRP